MPFSPKQDSHWPGKSGNFWRWSGKILDYKNYEEEVKKWMMWLLLLILTVHFHLVYISHLAVCRLNRFCNWWIVSRLTSILCFSYLVPIKPKKHSFKNTNLKTLVHNLLITVKGVLMESVYGEDESTKIDPKFPKKLKYLFWTVRESRGILFHQVNGNPAKAIVSRHFHCCIHWIFAAMY